MSLIKSLTVKQLRIDVKETCIIYTYKFDQLAFGSLNTNEQYIKSVSNHAIKVLQTLFEGALITLHQ